MATLLAVATMRLKFSKHQSVWELQEQKATGFLEKQGIGHTEIICQRGWAQALVEGLLSGLGLYV